FGIFLAGSPSFGGPMGSGVGPFIAGAPGAATPCGAAMAGAPQPPLPQDGVQHESQHESHDLLNRARSLSKKLGLAQQSSQQEVQVLQVGAQVVGQHESQQSCD